MLGPFLRRLVSSAVPESWRARALRRENARWSEHDEKSLIFYRQLVPANGLVFDVGANVGRRTRILRRIPARVVAVEPQPHCIRLLRALFAGADDVHIEAKALGARAGEAELLVADVDTISTMDPGFVEATRRSGRFARHEWKERVTVPVATLDAIIELHGVPDFVKVDVEGYELEVLRGLTRALPAVSLEFVPELAERSAACLERLATLGPVEVNLSLGESMRWAWSVWRTPQAALPALEALRSRTDLFGDVYVRTARP